MIVVDLASMIEGLADLQRAVASRVQRQVEPTVVGFRPLPTAKRRPTRDPESVIVDDLGVAPRRCERRDR